MGDKDEVTSITKTLEHLLETRYGARGRNLHEKVTSVETYLDPQLVKQLGIVAGIRDNVFGKSNYNFTKDRDRFFLSGYSAIEKLEASESRQTISNKNTRLRSKNKGHRQKDRAPRSAGSLITVNKFRKVISGIFLLFGMHIAAFIILLILAYIVRIFNTQLAANLILALFYLGLLQIIYVIPIAIWLKQKQQGGRMKGVIIGAVITALVNVSLLVLWLSAFG